MSLKFTPHPKITPWLNQLFNNFGKALTHTFNHIKNIHDSYTELPTKTKGTCAAQKTKICANTKPGERNLTHQKNNQKYCRTCFMTEWSMFTLLQSNGYLKTLRTTFPELGTASTYYNGVIKYAVQAFNSWQAKRAEHNKKITKTEEQIQKAKSTITKQRAIKDLAYLRKKTIKDFQFKNNLVYFGNSGSYDFKQGHYNTENQRIEKIDGRGDTYWVGIQHHTKHALTKTGKASKSTYSRIWMPLKLGRATDYKTAHNKFERVQDCIDTGYHKSVYTKMLRRPKSDGTYLYEVMLPLRDEVQILTTPENLAKKLAETPETPIVCVSMGVNKPLTASVFVDNKIVSVKQFGNGGLSHYVMKCKARRNKLKRLFRARYKSKRKAWRARRKYEKRHYKIENGRIKVYAHTITRKLVKWVLKECPDAHIVLVMRDVNGLKRITYNSNLRGVLTSWNVSMSSTFLEYKALLAGVSVFKIRYAKTNHVTCDKCERKLLHDNKGISVLTSVLVQSRREPRYWKHHLKTLNAKINKLHKYPESDKRKKLIIRLRAKHTEAQKKLVQSMGMKPRRKVRCDNRVCGREQDFHVSDAALLRRKLNSHILASAEVPIH